MPSTHRTTNIRQFLLENGPQSFPKLKGSKEDAKIFEKIIESDDDIYVDHNLNLLRLLSVERECFVASPTSKGSTMLTSVCNGLSRAKYPFLRNKTNELEQIVVEYLLNTNDFFLWGDKVYSCRNGRQKMPTISEYKDVFEIFTFLDRNFWGDYDSNCTLQALKEENKSWPSIVKRNNLFFTVDSTITWNVEAFIFDVSEDGKKLLESNRKVSVRRASVYLCAEYLFQCLRTKLNGTATIDQLFSALKPSSAPAQIYLCDITSPSALRNFLVKTLSSKIDFKTQNDKELISVRDNSLWEELCVDAVHRKTKKSSSKAKKPDKQTIAEDFVALDKEEFLLFQQTQEAKKKAEKLAEKARSGSEVDDECSWQSVAKRHAHVHYKASSTPPKTKVSTKPHHKHRNKPLPVFMRSQSNRNGNKSANGLKTSFGSNRQQKKPTQAYQRQTHKNISPMNQKTTYGTNQRSRAANGTRPSQQGMTLDKRSPAKSESLPKPFPDYKPRVPVNMQQPRTRTDKISHSFRGTSTSDELSRVMEPDIPASRPSKIHVLNDHSTTTGSKNIKAEKMQAINQEKKQNPGYNQGFTVVKQTKQGNEYGKDPSSLNGITTSTPLLGTNIAPQPFFYPAPVDYFPSMINKRSIASSNEDEDTEQRIIIGTFENQSSGSHFTEDIFGTRNPKYFKDTGNVSDDLKQMLPHSHVNIVDSQAKTHAKDEEKNDKKSFSDQSVSEIDTSNMGYTLSSINSKLDVIRSVLENRGDKVHINILFLHCQIKKKSSFHDVQELMSYIESENASLEMRDCWVGVKRTFSRPRALIPQPVA